MPKLDSKNRQFLAGQREVVPLAEGASRGTSRDFLTEGESFVDRECCINRGRKQVLVSDQNSVGQRVDEGPPPYADLSPWM